MPGFEFSANGRRYLLVRGGRPGLESGAAAALLQRALARDVSLRIKLVVWARRTDTLVGLADDAGVLVKLLRELGTGWVRVHALGPVRGPALVHQRPKDDSPTADEHEPQLSWLEAIIEDEDGRPLGDLELRVTLPDGSSIEARTDPAGRLWIDQIPTGDCRLELELPLRAFSAP